MSGFKDDVISILRQNSILQKEAIGLIEGRSSSELFEYLQSQGYPVARKVTKPVVRFDYIVLNSYFEDLRYVISALSNLSENGILVIQITNEEDYENKYFSKFGNFSVIKVRFGTRCYLVFKNGVDYGD